MPNLLNKKRRITSLPTMKALKKTYSEKQEKILFQNELSDIK